MAIQFEHESTKIRLTSSTGVAWANQTLTSDSPYATKSLKELVRAAGLEPARP